MAAPKNNRFVSHFPASAADGKILIISAALAALFALALNLSSISEPLSESALFLSILFAVLFFAAFLSLAAGGMVRNPVEILLLASVLFFGFLFRIREFPYESHDYYTFLETWVQYFREHGFMGLKDGVGNYNVPYLYFLALFAKLKTPDLYLIKLLSVIFDLFTAFFAAKLVLHFTKKPLSSLLCFSAIFLLPTVMLNSSAWSQCDSIYAGLGLSALYFGLKDRPVLSLFLFTAAFGFKLQIIFLLPVVFVLLLFRKIKLKQLLLMPLFYLALMMPAVFTGLPFADTLSIYFDQAGTYAGHLALNAPSIFGLFKDKPIPLPLGVGLGVLAAFLFLAYVLFFAWRSLKKQNISPDRIILTASLLMVVGIPFFLPAMHDRYFYLADVLSVAAAFIFPILLPVPFLVQAGSLLCYAAYLRGTYVLPPTHPPIFMGAALIWLVVFAHLQKPPMQAAPPLSAMPPQEEESSPS